MADAVAPPRDSRADQLVEWLGDLEMGISAAIESLDADALAGARTVRATAWG